MPTPLDKLLEAAQQAQTEGTFEKYKTKNTDKKTPGINNKPKPVRISDEEIRNLAKEVNRRRKIMEIQRKLGMDTATNKERIEKASSEIGKEMIAEQQEKLKQYYQIIKEINESEPHFFSFSSADDDDREIERKEK